MLQEYDIYLNGDETVGIGAVDGDSNLEIHDCEATVDLAVDSGVCIGSVHQNASVKIWSSLAKCNIAGKRITAVGTIDGAQANVDVHDMGLILNVNGDLTSGISPELAPASPRVGIAAAPQAPMVVLHQDAIVHAHAMVRAAAARDGVLLKNA